jgi:hypothetical protein
MEDDRTIIYEFLSQFEDFTAADRESGYKNVYRPERHPVAMQFWFNPPFSEDNDVSMPVPSSAMILTSDGKIMVENMFTGLFFNLSECIGDSIENCINSIENYYRKITLG